MSIGIVEIDRGAEELPSAAYTLFRSVGKRNDIGHIHL
jgi:hypothetical protein